MGLRKSNPFQYRDDIRVAFSEGLLVGEGIEIGAGAFPQDLPAGAVARYYDLRTDEQTAELFQAEVVNAKPVAQAKTDYPRGADFLIAHNVLEHCPNPIGVLMGWHRLVREGGVVVISLPHHLHCYDALRLMPPIEHLIDDHLAGADGNDFPSREHIMSFALGWWESMCESHSLTTLRGLAEIVLDSAHHQGADAHWHSFNMPLSLKVVAMAVRFDGLEIRNLRCWAPETGETAGDILISYTIGQRGALSAEIQQLLDVSRIRSALVARLSDQAASDERGVRENRPIAIRLTAPFEKEGKYCFRVALPEEFLSQVKEGMTLSVREGVGCHTARDARVLGPMDALHDSIRQEGGGACSFWNGTVYFSSSDRTDCNHNNRSYFVVAEP